MDVTEEKTIIHSDALSTYNQFNTNFIHLTINKKKEGFSQIDESTGILKTVNHIENIWKHLRQLERERHMNRPEDVVYICIEYMFQFYKQCVFN